MAQHTTVELADFERIHERLDRAYQRLFGGPGSPSSFGARYYEPPVDIYEVDSEVVVLVEMAGISNQELQIEVEGRNMVISGRREPLPGPANREYSQIEITDGPFQRVLLLPAAVNPAGADATYADGIVKIVLPKAAATGGTRIHIVCH
jgi:HSP20 family protein